MRHRIPFVILVILCGVAVASLAHPAPAPKSSFDPAELKAAADIPYPFDSVAFGTVVLEVAVDTTGNVEGVQPIRSIASLTEPASKSVMTWKFRPATLNGAPVRSRIPVAVMFNPVAAPAENSLPPRAQRENSDNSLPPDSLSDVVSAQFAVEPSAAMPGSVVLKAKVNVSGEIESVLVVRDAPPFTYNALQAVKKWRFTPAQHAGQLIDSYVALAFVFRIPPNN